MTRKTWEQRPIEDVFNDLGTLEEIMRRHGFETSKRFMTCPNPQHLDKRPGSVGILPETPLGRERIVCHSCGLNEDAIGLARLLGERVEFMRQTGEDTRTTFSRRFLKWHPPLSVKQIQKRTRLLKELADDPTIQRDWIAAKTLARLGNRRTIQRQILADYEFMTSHFNLPRVWTLINRIWEWGIRVHGLPHQPDNPASWKAWAERVTKELEA